MLFHFFASDWTLGITFILSILFNAAIAYATSRAQNELLENCERRGLKNLFNSTNTRAATVMAEIARIPKTIFFVSLLVHLYVWL